jgi:hypothetical protein
MLIFGIIALVTGKFSLTRSRVVMGGPARAVGIILLMPLVIGQGGGIAIAALKGVQIAARGGGPVDRQALQKELTQELETPLLILNVGVTAFSAVLVAVIALVTAKPAPPKRRRREEDESEEEYEDEGRRDDEPRRRPDDEPRRPPDDRITP